MIFAATSDDVAIAFIELGLIVLGLAVLARLSDRLGVSPIPAYLVAGLLFGDGGIATPELSGDFLQLAAEIGVVLLLLTLGLEYTPDELRDGLRRNGRAGVVDVVLNALPGAAAAILLGWGLKEAVLLAGITYISSSGVIARLLSDLRRLGNRETPAVLSILVLEDFAMAAYLPLLAVLATGGTWLQALFGMAIAVAALSIAFAASYRWGHHIGRLVAHPDNEQVLLRILGITLIVAALAEFVHASAAVGAFLVGLTLTGESADRARSVLSPLRDLFAAIFFLAIGLSMNPADLVPMLPAALALAVVTALTKVLTGQFAARREGVGRPGQLRAGTALIARGEFSLVIIGLVGTSIEAVGTVATPYVFILAIVGPVLTRFTGVAPRPARRAPSDGPDETPAPDPR